MKVNFLRKRWRDLSITGLLGTHEFMLLNWICVHKCFESNTERCSEMLRKFLWNLKRRTHSAKTSQNKNRVYSLTASLCFSCAEPQQIACGIGSLNNLRISQDKFHFVTADE